MTKDMRKMPPIIKAYCVPYMYTSVGDPSNVIPETKLKKSLPMLKVIPVTINVIIFFKPLVLVLEKN